MTNSYSLDPEEQQLLNDYVDGSLRSIASPELLEGLRAAPHSPPSIRTLYIRHVRDEVAAGLEKLAARQLGLMAYPANRRSSGTVSCGFCITVGFATPCPPKLHSQRWPSRSC